MGHWLIYNLPPDSQGLPENAPADGYPTADHFQRIDQLLADTLQPGSKKPPSTRGLFA
jgi:hypothetical protein